MADHWIGAAFSKALSFIRRQPRDWKVTVVRTSLQRFVYQMLFPYQSIYIVALGASATQLGLVNSVGMGVAGLVSPLTGWLIDRIGTKRIYLAGIGLLAISYLVYGVAQSWLVTIFAMAAYWLGFSISILGCATVCGNCLAREDRATGMTLCETVAAGLLGMAGPMLGAWLVSNFGGVTVTGIRPLNYIALGVTAGTFVLVLGQLSDRRWGPPSVSRSGFLKDIAQVFEEGHNLKRWLVISAVTQLPLGMVFPFSQVFAQEIKGADGYVLGAMVTACALTSVVFAVPLGRLADALGRKKVIYLTMPLFWASNFILLWAPSAGFLIAAGVLQGFYYIGAPVAAAMERELVPATQMGRWLGTARAFKMLLSACLAFVSGMIWDGIGPQYVFLSFVFLDLVVRLPLLISMPETLNLRLSKDRPAGSTS